MKTSKAPDLRRNIAADNLESIIDQLQQAHHSALIVQRAISDIDPAAEAVMALHVVDAMGAQIAELEALWGDEFGGPRGPAS